LTFKVLLPDSAPEVLNVNVGKRVASAPGSPRVAALAALLLGVLVTCAPRAAPTPAASDASSPASASAPAAAARGETVEIVHATWASHADALKPAFEKFERETGIRVTPAIGGDGDRLTRLYAERGSPSIDAALIPRSEGMKLLEQGIVEPPNMDLPNAKNLVPAAHHPAGYVTSLFAIGLAYNPAKGKPTSWTDLWDPKYRGKVALSMWPNTTAATYLVMAARLNGGSDDNLEPGFAALQRLLPVKFYNQGNAVEPLYVQGDVWIHPAIHGAVMQLKERGVPIDWVAPKEGAIADYNLLVIPKGVRNKAAAEQFADFFLGPDVQLAYAQSLFYSPVNSAVTVPPNLAPDLHPTPEEQRNLQPMPWDKLATMDAELTERWNKEVGGR